MVIRKFVIGKNSFFCFAVWIYVDSLSFNIFNVLSKDTRIFLRISKDVHPSSTLHLFPNGAAIVR